MSDLHKPSVTSTLFPPRLSDVTLSPNLPLSPVDVVNTVIVREFKHNTLLDVSQKIRT